MLFNRYIGIDYSGRGEPTERTAGIQVVEVTSEGQVERRSPNERTFSWSRQELSEYIGRLLIEETKPVIIGIDHSLSFPIRYFNDNGLQSWQEFLDHFSKLWNTKEQAVRVAREQVPPYPNHTELRLTEKHTATAKSAWNFEQKTGTVAYSTHAGIPWVYEWRKLLKNQLHIWPYDGWNPQEGKHVLAEAYPALFYQRFRDTANFPTEWPRDAQDAYAIARWLWERDRNGTIDNYFSVETLTAEEKEQALRYEGWIIGVG